jgi:acyl-CoA thioester hydrolase
MPIDGPQEGAGVSDWNVTSDRRVEWSDVDGYRHVNNVAIVRWFEAIRNVHLEHMGFAIDTTDSVVLIMKRQTVEYQSEFVYGQVIRLGSRICEIRKCSFEMEFAAWHSTVGARGSCVMVYYDRERREKRPISAGLFATLSHKPTGA